MGRYGNQLAFRPDIEMRVTSGLLADRGGDLHRYSGNHRAGVAIVNISEDGLGALRGFEIERAQQTWPGTVIVIRVSAAVG
jgi:hypothetical protein